ncbi:hypothetical protein GCM10007858_47530 [Bradyrhizobium liaoningense]|nr:hypothetical protein GCM10007858_47530 [Bradyrhizobium liaoningense]
MSLITETSLDPFKSRHPVRRSYVVGRKPLNIRQIYLLELAPVVWTAPRWI